MRMVHIDNVSKCFRLGTANEYGRLTEAIAMTLKRAMGLIPPRPPLQNEKPLQNQMPMQRTSGDYSQNTYQFSPRLQDGVFWALRNLSLEVKQGEILGIVGRNGAGKSTLLKLLSRIVSPTTGRVGVRGRVGSLLEVGTGFHPELTGRENIFLNGSILGMSRHDIRRRFDDIVDFADIGAFLDTPVKRYSSGMAVRLAFSVAAYLEPDVLIVDEVLAVGDQAFQDKCIGKARELGGQGRTILLVSHNLASVANLCTRAVYLRDGILVGDADPGTIIDQYLQESVGSSGYRQWEGDQVPRTADFALHSVRIRTGNEACDITGEVDIDREVHIEVEFEVLRDGVFATPGIRLKDETSTYVLWSTNATSMNLEADPYYGIALSKGKYRTACTIPANFLNANKYLVSVTMGSHPGENAIDIEGAVSFLVHDTGAMRKEFAGNWTGPIIRPRLRWSTQEAPLCLPNDPKS